MLGGQVLVSLLEAAVHQLLRQRLLQAEENSRVDRAESMEPLSVSQVERPRHTLRICTTPAHSVTEWSLI